MKNIAIFLMILIVHSTGEGLLYADEAAEEEKVNRRTDGFEYPLDDRMDPFYSFVLRQEARRADDNEVEITDEVLIGLRAFEPGQLRLVAIMSTPRGRIAMAEDTTGKGYTLHEGVEIGRFGRIEKIGDGQVIIRESAPTRAGRVVEREVIMRLRRDGER
jgi:type IV pilus assembly protein PilP